MSRRRTSENKSVDRGLIAHQQAIWGMFVLIMLGLVVVVGVPLLLAIAVTPEQLGTIASFMSTLIGLVVSVFCLLNVAILVGLMFLIAKIYGQVRKVAHGVHKLVYNLHMRVERLAPRIAAPVVSLNSRFAALEATVKNGLGLEQEDGQG